MNMKAIMAAQSRPTKPRRDAVAEVLADGQLHTLGDLSARTGYNDASVSAELREMRRRHGLNIVREVVQRFERHIVYGYKKAEGPATMRKSLALSAPPMLRRVRAYLRTFRKLDPDGDRLLADVRSLLGEEGRQS